MAVQPRDVLRGRAPPSAVPRALDSGARPGYALGMPIADDRPRNASSLTPLTLRHPIGGALHYDLDPAWKDPADPAAPEEIVADLEERGLDWPPPLEFAEASLRHKRSVYLAADGKIDPADRRREQDRYESIRAEWAAGERAYRAERGRRRLQLAQATVRVGPLETVASEGAGVTARELQPADAAGRPVGGAYRLERDLTQGEQRVLGPGGSELSVVRARGFEADGGGRAWAERVVKLDLRRGPRRGLRAYEVKAGVDGRLQPTLGTRQVEAHTSAEALRAVPARRFAAGLGPGRRDVLLTAIALDDPGDYSYAAYRVHPRERHAGRGRPAPPEPADRAGTVGAGRGPAASRAGNPLRRRPFARAIPPGPRGAGRGPRRASGPSR